jgi:hypothetical protein
VRLALANDDDDLILRILGARLPAWSTLRGIARDDTRALISRALVVADNDMTHSRLNAWLAAEIALENPTESAQLMDNAIALARASGDRDTLVDCLMRFASTAASPHVLDRRRAAIAELLEIVRPLDQTTRYFALNTFAVASIQAGDVRQADLALAESDAIARQHDLGPLRWSRLVARAWRSALAGDLTEAGGHICAAAQFGAERGIAAALDTATMQAAFLQWQQGRFGERAAQIRENHTRVVDTFPAVALVLARALAENADGRDEARGIVAPFMETGFAQVRTASFWSSILLLTAETALLARMPEASAAIRDLLLPFADQVAHAGMWVTGPVAYGLAVACLGCGDPRADTYLPVALKTAARMEAPLLAEKVRQAPALRAR